MTRRKFKDYEKKIGFACFVLGIILLLFIFAVNYKLENRIDKIESFIETQRTFNSDQLNYVKNLNSSVKDLNFTIDMHYRQMSLVGFVSYINDLNNSEFVRVNKSLASANFGCVLTDSKDFYYGVNPNKFTWYMENRSILFNNTDVSCYDGRYDGLVDCKEICK